ncbi:hypothetical protein ASF30_11005 [Leifsonia sp. Leaf264]|nr:hypothetical protein ASF30_11005 [Leifsonia sp. Leaf264]
MLAWEQEKLGGYYLSGTEQDAFEAGWDARGPGWRTGTLTVDFQVLAGPASYQEADEKIRALLEEAGYTIGSFGISGQLPKTDPSD